MAIGAWWGWLVAMAWRYVLSASLARPFWRLSKNPRLTMAAGARSVSLVAMASRYRGLSVSGPALLPAEQLTEGDHGHRCDVGVAGGDGLTVGALGVEDLGVERGHPTLRILGKGNHPAVVVLVLRTARTIDVAIGNAARDRSSCATPASGSTRTACRCVRSTGHRSGARAVVPT
jgi:hypothetical protein